MSRLWPAWLVQPRLAVVLGGGATLGAFEVGVVDSLARSSIVPDILVGTSAGAINASYWAFHPSPTVGERLIELWLGANQTTMLPGGPLPMFGRLIQGQDHLTTQIGLKRLLSKALPEGAMVEDASIRLAIVVTDAETGRREVLRQGPLQPAVLASSAIPGLFPPVRIGSRRFVDGGLAANCDIEAAIESGATDVMVVDVMGDRPPSATYSMAAVIERSIGIVMRRQTDLEAMAFGSRARIAVLRADIGPRPHPWDFSQTRFLYERGRQAADAFLGKHYRANRSVRPGLFRFDTGQGLDAEDGPATGPRAASEEPAAGAVTTWTK